MKAVVKLLALFTCLTFFSDLVQAQLKLNSNNTIGGDIKKVIDDYPSHFDNIKGELIIENPQSSDYACNFRVVDAETCTITRYTARKQVIASWQALMLTTESFEDAKKKFKTYYNQLNNLAIKSMRLKGVYETPLEEMKFTSVIFSFDKEDAALSKLRVELVIEAEQMDWKVRILVYDRDRNDEERGKVIE
jgi:hypothetical protein